MKKTIPIVWASAVVLALAGSMSFAQSSGEATYKAKCQSCHGATGIPTPAMAKAMNVKPASDPAVKARTEAQMIDATKKGVGKMPGYAGKLTDTQIKDAVGYFRSLGK
jgi:cytochrome c6